MGHSFGLIEDVLDTLQVVMMHMLENFAIYSDKKNTDQIKDKRNI
jgi:hypothetical protein